MLMTNHLKELNNKLQSREKFSKYKLVALTFFSYKSADTVTTMPSFRDVIKQWSTLREVHG